MKFQLIILATVTALPMALSIDWDQEEIIYKGKWGSWKNWVITDEPDYYGCGAQVRFEKSQGSGDDTAANGLKIKFCDANDWSSKTHEEIYGGKWGDWGDWQMCDRDYYINGAQVRFEKSQGGGDDTALNGLKILCTHPESQQSTWVVVEEGKWGTWREEVEAKPAHFLKGAQVRFENSQGSGDDTAWNGLKMRFAEMHIDPTEWCVRPGSDCYDAHLGKGCDHEQCQAVVCDKDPFCCDTMYDRFCKDAAKDHCPECVTRRMLRA